MKNILKTLWLSFLVVLCLAINIAVWKTGIPHKSIFEMLLNVATYQWLGDILYLFVFVVFLVAVCRYVSEKLIRISLYPNIVNIISYILILQVSVCLLASSDNFHIEKNILDFKPVVKPITIEGRFRNLPDVYVVVIESLHYDSIKNMPNFMDVARRNGIVCLNNYSTSNMSHLGVYGVLNGQYPINYDNYGGSDNYTCEMPRLFKSIGYKTRYFSSGDVEGFMAMDKWINEEYFDEMFVSENDTYEYWPESDKDIIRRSLQSDKIPEFNVLYLNTTHYPYWLNGEQGDYQKCVEYVDRILAPLYELNGAIIVVTGDHGESSGKDGVEYHSSRASDEQMRVPLLIYSSNITNKRIITQFTSNVDILPTIFGLLGFVVENSHGVNLTNNQPDNRRILAVPNYTPVPRGYDVNKLLVLLESDNRYVFERYPQYSFIGEIDKNGNCINSDKDHDLEELSYQLGEILIPNLTELTQ